MVESFFKIAAQVAAQSNELDKRSFLLGACAIRSRDSKIVKSANGATFSSAGHTDFTILPNAHAEYRVLRKAGKGSTLFVVRVLRRDGTLAIARPCGMCRTFLAAYDTKMVYYSISDDLYGVWNPATNEEFVRER